MTNQYETKDSGERAQFESGMQRDTQTGKPRFDLTQPKDVPFEEQLLTRFARLMGRGAEKYTERNWEQASGEEELDRFLASAFRHFMQWYHGERDEDHAAAVMFNLMGYEATFYKMKQAEEQEAREIRYFLDRSVGVPAVVLDEALNGVQRSFGEIPVEDLRI